MRSLQEKRSPENKIKENRERDILFGSGLIAGDGIIGVGLAFFLGLSGMQISNLPNICENAGFLTPILSSRIFSLIMFSSLGYLLWYFAMKKK